MTITAKGWVTAHFDEVGEKDREWYVVDGEGLVSGPHGYSAAWEICRKDERYDAAEVTVIRAGSPERAIERSRFFFA